MKDVGLFLPFTYPCFTPKLQTCV